MSETRPARQSPIPDPTRSGGMIETHQQNAPTPPDGGLRADFKTWRDDSKAATCSLEQWVQWRDTDPAFSEWAVARGHVHNLLDEALDRLAAHPAPTPVAGEGDGLAVIVAAHAGWRDSGVARHGGRPGKSERWFCSCGDQIDDDWSGVNIVARHRAHVADAIRAAGWEAEAWDRGYTAGHSNAMRRMSDEPNAPTSPNPYREATP